MSTQATDVDEGRVVCSSGNVPPRLRKRIHSGSPSVRTILCGSLATALGFAVASAGHLGVGLGLVFVVGLVLGRLDRGRA